MYLDLECVANISNKPVLHVCTSLPVFRRFTEVRLSGCRDLCLRRKTQTKQLGREKCPPGRTAYKCTKPVSGRTPEAVVDIKYQSYQPKIANYRRVELAVTKYSKHQQMHTSCEWEVAYVVQWRPCLWTERLPTVTKTARPDYALRKKGLQALLKVRLQYVDVPTSKFRLIKTRPTVNSALLFSREVHPSGAESPCTNTFTPRRGKAGSIYGHWSRFEADVKGSLRKRDPTHRTRGRDQNTTGRWNKERDAFEADVKGSRRTRSDPMDPWAEPKHQDGPTEASSRRHLKYP
ncbi:hypothetical protein Bbelb_095980 [Branchiostoma belcheri]|nr:hypothetical protein Bbelb_095980 [Branchiostoma belcheri]